MGMHIPPGIRAKLAKKHGVTEEEINQAFANRVAGDLFETREEHQTDPRTRWFIAQTDYGRKLKVCFMYYPDNGLIVIKTAYPANTEEVRIYDKYAKPI